MNDIVHESVTLPAVPQGGPVTPMRLLEIATQQGADIDKLEKLMVLQERWEKNEAKKAFDDAVSKAKAEIPVIFKNRAVDFTSQKGRTNYRYEDFAEVARTVDPILAKHGLSYRFRTASANAEVTVTCVLAHRMGHSEENGLSVGRDESGNKNNIQAVGSAITFLQRYTLKAALGLSASTDTDARATATTDEQQPDAEGKAALEACGSLNALQEAWKALTVEQRKTLAEVKEECKQRIKKADEA